MFCRYITAEDGHEIATAQESQVVKSDPSPTLVNLNLYEYLLPRRRDTKAMTYKIHIPNS